MAHILCIPLSRITHEARRSKRKQHNGDKLFLWREFFIIILSQLIPNESLMLGQLWDPISPPKLFMTKKLNMRWLFLWPVLQNMSKWTSMGCHPVLFYVLKFSSMGWRPILIYVLGFWRKSPIFLKCQNLFRIFDIHTRLLLVNLPCPMGHMFWIWAQKYWF